jgi:hypothetical protein
MKQSTVRMRVAFVLRSAEVQLLFLDLYAGSPYLAFTYTPLDRHI